MTENSFEYFILFLLLQLELYQCRFCTAEKLALFFTEELLQQHEVNIHAKLLTGDVTENFNAIIKKETRELTDENEIIECIEAFLEKHKTIKTIGKILKISLFTVLFEYLIELMINDQSVCTALYQWNSISKEFVFGSL